MQRHDWLSPWTNRQTTHNPDGADAPLASFQILCPPFLSGRSCGDPAQTSGRGIALIISDVEVMTEGNSGASDEINCAMPSSWPAIETAPATANSVTTSRKLVDGHVGSFRSRNMRSDHGWPCLLMRVIGKDSIERRAHPCEQVLQNLVPHFALQSSNGRPIHSSIFVAEGSPSSWLFAHPTEIRL